MGRRDNWTFGAWLTGGNPIGGAVTRFSIDNARHCCFLDSGEWENNEADIFGISTSEGMDAPSDKNENRITPSRLLQIVTGPDLNLWRWQ